MVLKDEKEFAGDGKQKGSVRVETTTRMSVQNRHQKPPASLSHNIEEVEVRRESAPEDGVPEVRSTAVQGLLGNFAPNHLLTFGLPNVIKSESGCKIGEKCSFAHRQVEGHPAKSRKRMVTRVQWPY